MLDQSFFLHKHFISIQRRCSLFHAETHRLLRITAVSFWCLGKGKGNVSHRSFLSFGCSTSLLSSGVQRQLIVTRRSKPSGKTFRGYFFSWGSSFRWSILSVNFSKPIGDVNSSDRLPSSYKVYGIHVWCPAQANVTDEVTIFRHSGVTVTRALIAKIDRICKYVKCDDSGISKHARAQNDARSFLNETIFKQWTQFYRA